MALKGQTSRKILYTAFLALDISLFIQLMTIFPSGGLAGIARGRYALPVPVNAGAVDNESGIVQRVHVDGTLDFHVVQQPEGDANYVSSKNGELTQFGAVSQYGNVGLLAHNYLAGKSFSRLIVGQNVQVLYSSGDTESFVITEVLSYQALDPKNPYSSFQNLMNESEVLSVGQMFDRVYKGDHHLTFQTCISNDGLSSWGRLFVVATPKPDMTGFEAGALQTKITLGP